MLDWFTGFVGYDGSKLPLDRLIRVSSDGSIQYEKDSWLSVPGSWDSRFAINRTLPTLDMLQSSRNSGYLINNSCLRLSGNPVKFLQGHNLYGPSVSELGNTIQSFVKKLSESLPISDAHEKTLPAVHRSKIDVTLMFDLGTDQCVHNWITTALLSTRTRSKEVTNFSKQKKRNLSGVSSVYWNDGSDRWEIMGYCKLCEMIARKPNCDKKTLDDLLQLAHGVLRLELSLYRKELKDKGNLTEEIFWDYFNRIEISDMKNKDENRKNISLLTTASQRTYLLWEAGQELPVSRMTFYRHRKEIKEKFNIDIAIANKEISDVLEPVDKDMFGKEFLAPVQRPDIPLCQQPERVAAFFRSFETDLFKGY